MMQETIKADRKIFLHRIMKITSVGTSLSLRVVEATFVLEDAEESEKGLTLVWFWALCWPWNTLHQRALCTVGGGSVSLGQGAKDSNWVHINKPRHLGDSKAEGNQEAT